MRLQAISKTNRLKYSLTVGAYYGKCPMIKVAMQGYHSYPYCNYSMCKCQFITFKNLLTTFEVSINVSTTQAWVFNVCYLVVHVLSLHQGRRNQFTLVRQILLHSMENFECVRATTRGLAILDNSM